MPHATPQVGDVIAGKYRVESILGRGGMGVVFAARHTISERRVALKWMEADLQDEPDSLERFVREAKAMGRIEHPNVVGVLDVGTEGTIAYLVMEILRGESLRALIAREKRLSPEVALRTLLPALEGVEAAHRAGVVHRDLKPENLFVVRSASGEAQTTKVLDFGISKLTENDSRKREARKLTKTGHVVGTPTYMAPEQVRGATIDGRTDVWALSTILYEMLSGRAPFDGDNYGALLVAIAVEPYAPLDPNVVPPDLARVVHKGLAKEPGDRWQSVLELARALEPFARGVRFAEPRSPSLAPPGPSAPRESAAPTVAGVKRAAPIEAAATVADPAPSAVATPELDLPAVRAPRQAAGAAPTPIRIARPSAPETGDAGEVGTGPGQAPDRRWMTLAAVAVAVLVALVLVIRGIGNAARDAALTLPAPTAVEPLTERPPPSAAAEDEPPVPVDERQEPPRAPDLLAPPPTTTVGVDPPPASARARHAEGTRSHTALSEEARADPPPTTTSARTTSTSRSGSITREDF